jgi:hypothetical protein
MEPKCSLLCSQEPTAGSYIMDLLEPIHIFTLYLFKKYFDHPIVYA